MLKCAIATYDEFLKFNAYEHIVSSWKRSWNSVYVNSCSLYPRAEISV